MLIKQALPGNNKNAGFYDAILKKYTAPSASHYPKGVKLVILVKKRGTSMPMSIEQILSETQILSDESKALLAEKLVASIEEKIDPQITKIHLAEVIRRRDEIRSGKAQPINGEEGLAKVRATLEQ
ncbi:MAG: addiction module protein [Thermodesulfobacteriota bacterium]